MDIHFGILTASDRSARGERPDESGPALAGLVRGQGWTVNRQAILPDERDALVQAMVDWSEGGEVDVMLITGGTGFGPRDITPEATRQVIDREAPGLAEAMRAASLRTTPYAMLSRSVVGIRRKMLIINLPGSPRGATENLQAVLPVLEHAIRLLKGEEAGH